MKPRRRVRSFVRRAGRVTSAQARALAQLWPRFGIEAPDYEPMTFYSSDAEEEDPAAFLANLHGSYDAETPAPEPIG